MPHRHDIKKCHTGISYFNVMKVKNILYRNINDLNKEELEFYEENKEKFELNTCDRTNCIYYSDDLVWEVEHLGYTAVCEEVYDMLTALEDPTS